MEKTRLLQNSCNNHNFQDFKRFESNHLIRFAGLNQEYFDKIWILGNIYTYSKVVRD